MKIIGLGHYSRTGKDSFANYLIKALEGSDLRVAKLPFAGKLKIQTHELYGWAGLREAAWYDTPEGEPHRNIVLPAIGKTPVEIWIEFGMAGRAIYPATWIDFLLKTDHGLDVLLIPDLRFENETEAIRERGGTLVKVVRPGYGPRKSPADRALLCYRDWDFVIGQSGEMSELDAWANRFASWLIDTEGLSLEAAEIERGQSNDKAQAYAVEKIEPWERDHEWLKPGWSLEEGRLVYSEARAAA